MNSRSLRPSTSISFSFFFLDRQENNAYQLAALEQQNQLHDSLNDLNRSLLANQERQHADVEEVSLQVDGLREDLNRLFTDSFRGTQRSELTITFIHPECALLMTEPQTCVQSNDGDGKTVVPQTQKGANTPTEAQLARSNRFCIFRRRPA